MKKMYQIEFTSQRVKKELKKFNKQERQKIKKALDTLKKNPRPDSYHFSKLNKNKDVKRIRCQRVRIFYMIDEEAKKVHIGHLDLRNSNSYSEDPKKWFAAVS